MSKTSLSITVYGGAAGEIGGNRILLEWPARRWLLDFGMRFGPTGRFFEEFVQPRGATLGLRDYLRMGLIPPLEGLYRNDLSAHDPASGLAPAATRIIARWTGWTACCSPTGTWTTWARSDSCAKTSRSWWGKQVVVVKEGAPAAF